MLTPDPLAEILVYPVILSGGSGTRLWPLSRELYPKQLLPLVGEKTMLQETALRVSASAGFHPPLVICNEEHRFVIAEQLRHIRVSPLSIMLEPVGRNTAPALAVAAQSLVARDPEAIMLALPADHLIQDVPAFHEAVKKGRTAAEQGHLVTFGIVPTRPETGYGYIQSGGPLAGAEGVCAVQRFHEKPDMATAEKFVQDKNYAWNSGMFLFKAQAYLDELKRLHPQLLDLCRKAFQNSTQDLTFTRLDAISFKEAPSISIDVAVMEKTGAAAMVPVSFDWTDVGSWSALWEVTPHDPRGNAAVGDVAFLDSDRCYARAGRSFVAMVGVKDIITVVTDDAVLVASQDKAQDVKKIVETLKANNRPEVLHHTTVHRPWGSYQSLQKGERFQVKCISVEPGGRLSLQKHFHRAEHWIVVKGTAMVTRGEEQILLRENESIYIPQGMKHRLENPGRLPLVLIEVQSGSYLGEDDIVRFDDSYGRS